MNRKGLLMEIVGVTVFMLRVNLAVDQVVEVGVLLLAVGRSVSCLDFRLTLCLTDIYDLDFFFFCFF